MAREALHRAHLLLAQGRPQAGEEISSPASRLGITCASLAIGEALGFSTAGASVAWPLAALATLLVAAFGRPWGWRSWWAAFFLFAGLTLAMRCESLNRAAIRSVELGGGRCELLVDVREPPRVRPDSKSKDRRWVSVQSTFAGRSITVVFNDSAANPIPQIGETWRCSGWLGADELRRRTSPRLWVRGRGSFARCERPANPRSPVVLLAALRSKLSRRLAIGLDSKPLAANVLRAMILGERRDLDYSLRKTFTEAGTVHVFAISGLHVMIVAAILLHAIMLVGVPLRWTGPLLLPLLFAYVAMIGSPPSAVRAASMAGIYFLASAFCRRPDALAAWGVTMIGFALLDPVGFFGVGSLLSFAVMLAILLFVRWQRQFRSRLLAWLGVPFAAWAAGVPIVAHEFSQVTPGGLFANLLMVPLAGAAVTCGIAGMMLGFVSDTLAAHVNNFAALLAEAMVGTSWAFAHLPGGNLSVPPWSIAQCLAWYAAIFVLLPLLLHLHNRR